MNKIKTDGKWKNFKYAYEVPKKILKSQFDYLNEDFDGFVKYNKNWYYVGDFLRLESDQFPGWDGYISETYSSGIIIQLSPDGEQYRIGRYY